MKSSDEAAAPAATAPKKMSFSPGWARTSSVGLVRSTSLSQGSGISKPTSSASSHQGSGSAASQAAPQVPTPTPSTAFSNMSLGGKSAVAALTSERKVAPPQENSRASSLAPLGRVPSTSTRSGKLTEQANRFQKQARPPPRSPLGGPSQARGPGSAAAQVASGAPRIRYTRDELLQQYNVTTPPAFPAHLNEGLITPSCQTPSMFDAFDHDSLFAEWQIESDKRAAAHPRAAGHAPNGALTGDRRGVRGRRSDNMIDPGNAADQQRSSRPFPQSGGGSSWRNGGPGGPPPSKDVQGGPGRFGGIMRGDKERWAGSRDPGERTAPPAAGGRWSNLPTTADRRDNRDRTDRVGADRAGAENGASRWDRLGRSPSDRNSASGYGRSSQSSGDPSRDSMDQNRWRRGGLPGGIARDGGSHLVDDRGTFSDAALEPGDMGMDSMAADAQKFHMEMEAARRRMQDGAASPDLPPAQPPSHILGMMAGVDDDSILNEPLEAGLDQPPPEEVVPADQALDAAHQVDRLGREQTGRPGQQQPDSGSSWSASLNPWVAAAEQAPQPAPVQQGGWVVPPAGAAGISAAIPGQSQLAPQQSAVPVPQAPPMAPPSLHQPIGMLPGAGIPGIVGGQLPPDEWFYQDPQGNVQGPFKSEEMREWLEHGYFNMELLVRRGHSESFQALGQRFPDPRKAFSLEAERERHVMLMQRSMMLQQQQQPLPMQAGPLGAVSQPGQPGFWPGSHSNVMIDMDAQQQRMLLQQQQQQRLLQEEEDRVKRAEEAARAKREQEELQMRQRQLELLEQQRRQQEMEEERQRKFIEEEQARKQREEAEAARRAALQAEEQRRALLEAQHMRQMQELQEQREAEERARQEAERRKAEEKPAWGGVAASPALAETSKLSLKEIQEMEEREAQMQRPAGAVPAVSNSMAARIAQAAGVAGGRLQSVVANSAAPAGSQIVTEQAGQLSPPLGSPLSMEEPSAPVNAHGSTLNDMSVDLRAMLGVGGGSKKSSKSSQAQQQQQQPAWGGSSPAPVSAGNKSLKQIQEEEARRLQAQQQAQQQQAQAQLQSQQQAKKKAAQQAGGWASKAAPSRAEGWETEPPLAKPAAPGPGWTQPSKTQRGADLALSPSAEQLRQLHAHHNARTGRTDSGLFTEDNFGGKQMTADMRRWCEGQVQRLGATMTLVEFCFTLEDASDIREYLRDYLGSTPQVSAFASEFIQRKKGRKPNDDGADSAGFVPAATKKGKKKKKPVQ